MPGWTANGAHQDPIQPETTAEEAERYEERFHDFPTDHAGKRAVGRRERVADDTIREDAETTRGATEHHRKALIMRAVTWQGKRNVSVESVPDPKIEEPTDAVIKVTSTNICGSDLHLYEVLGPFMRPGDVLGHEPMGIVEEVGPEAGDLKVGDRAVIPFQIPCGSCLFCNQGLMTQCETTQVRDQGMGAALFGYSELYGSVPGGQAEYLRVPQAQFTHIKVPADKPDSRYVYLSDVLPTAWQAVAYAEYPAWRNGHSAGPRPDRRHGRTHRVTSGGARDRRRPGPGTAGAGAGTRHRDHRSRCGRQPR